MASYGETLADDRARVQRALESLVVQQEQRIEQLKVVLATDTSVLDQKIMRTVVLRNILGPGQTETLTSETETEEASKPVTDGLRQLERESQMLQAYQQALKQLAAGVPFEGLGKPEGAPS